MRPFRQLRAASAAFAASAALTAGLLGNWAGPATAATAGNPGPAAHHTSDPAPKGIPEDKRTKILGADYATSEDVAVTTSADATGFHILTAARADGYAWKTVASLSEPGFDTDTWIGNICVTGSGKRAVVVYAPRTFTNEAELMARGGFTAVVDLTTGKVTKLNLQASLSYYNPGCGAGETAVLTQSGGEDKPATRLVEVSTTRGQLASPVTVKGQLTSAVPTKDGIIAAASGYLVTVDSGGTTKTLAATRAVPYRLTPDAGGGLTYLEKARNARTTVKHLPPGSVVSAGTPRVLATGPRTDTGLTRAASGEVFITGATERTGRLPTAITHAPGTPARSLASTAGDALVTDTVWADGKDSRISAAEATRPRPVNINVQLLDTPEGDRPSREFTVTPGTPASVHAADGSAMSTALLHGTGKVPSSGSARAASPTDPVEDERVCSVPRNDPKNQAMQPKPRQVEWAVNQAVTGNLNKHISRPAGWKNLGMPAYQPQTLFPRPALEGGGRVPAQVMLGVTAQESNMWQAARSAVPGVTGNPLIGNFYGIDYYDYTSANDWDVDWAEADCGYGVTQVTDHMRRAGREGGGPTAWPYDKQRAVALDYTANIAAGLQILSDKWNQTRRAGLILNSGDVKRLENWFFALWAYNSGFYPESDASKHNGAWGVGWANNPANPEWDAGRSPFMEDRLGNDDYADAAHPQDWPYQEKVIGFAAHPPELLEAPNKPVAGFRPAWWSGTDGDATVKGSAKYHRALAKPPEDLFCSDLNDCRPDKIGDDASNGDSTTGPCVRGDFRCWWNTSAAWKADCDYTCGNEFVRFNDTYPEEADGTAYPPKCDLNGLPAGALIVDDIPNGTKSVRPNCSTQTSRGSFSFDFGEGETRPPDPTRYWPGKVDTHQIGGGFNGHFYFTHTRKGDTKGQRLKVSGTWKLDKRLSGWSRVLVHMPDHGAHTRQAKYVIDTGSGTKFRVHPQRLQSNKWVSLGVFKFSGTPKVTLSSITKDGTGDEDIAFDAVAFDELPAKPDNIIVAMGDSYSSGEGASVTGGGDYYPETDVDGGDGYWRNACHRSRHAWSRQAKLADDPSTPIGKRTDNWHTSMDYHLIACSGAETEGILGAAGPSNAWGEKGAHGYGELAQIDQGYLDESTTLVTLSIGGNDSRFAAIINHCIFGGIGWPDNCQDGTMDGDDEPLGTAQPKVIKEKVRPSIVTTLKEIKSKAPNAKIVLMGYPHLLNTESICLPLISKGEAEWFNEMADVLASEMNGAVIDARTAGVEVWFSDPRRFFEGKGACATDDERIHAIVTDKTPGDDPSLKKPSAQSLHPKISGATLYADVLNSTLREMGI
ncbi:NocE [Streptomyces synnematoformans]|uniref:Golvesin/Xly CBD-like domain-containing protein n=1 Tax=Streptomyces synnematoformans TaxID=415721 RepID=A0ABN2Y9Z3_9ACTN